MVTRAVAADEFARDDRAHYLVKAAADAEEHAHA